MGGVDGRGVATPSAPRRRYRACAVRHESAGRPKADSLRPSAQRAGGSPLRREGVPVSAVNGRSTGDGAIRDASAPPCRAGRPSRRGASLATRGRARSKTVGLCSEGAGVYCCASGRPIADAGPSSQARRLGARGRSGPSLEGRREAPSARAILSRIRQQDQPARWAGRIVATDRTATGLKRYAVLFIIELATRRVQIAGIASEPDSAWVVQCGRQLTDAVDGFLVGKRFLLHDRDPLFSDTFRETLAATGVETVRLPPRAPNLNAHAERDVRTSRKPA